MSFANNTLPIIYGCDGPVLSDNERAFFSEARPFGFILFQKNCANPLQVIKLCADLRESVGWHAPILIDQEGGRVQRLKPPHWPNFPAARGFTSVYAQNEALGLAAVENNTKAMAAAQCPLGVNVNCVPVLDVVPAANTARAIDDRSFGGNTHTVSALGLASLNAAITAKMTPVIKHIPGHGRAVVDSHFDLPHIDASLETLRASDFVPFAHVCENANNNQFWGMSAHVIYTDIDPELPATLSQTIIQNIIRDEIGFEGLLLSDDLFMEALAPFGKLPERAKACIEAGMDIALHCHGTVSEREAAARTLPPMRQDTKKRIELWQAAQD